MASNRRHGLLPRARRLALARAGVGGSRAWVTLSLVLSGVRLLRRMATRTPKVVYREELHPGEQLVVAHLPREGRGAS